MSEAANIQRRPAGPWRGVWLLALSCLAVTILSFVATGTSCGATNAKYKAAQSKISTILREDKTVPPEDAALFDEFFRDYLFPQFEQEENRTKLPQLRSDFKRFRGAAAGGSGPAHQQLNQLALAACTRILATKAPPDSGYDAVKFNIMLLLGDLNDVEPAAGIKGKPLAAALPVLLKYFNAKPASGKTSGRLDALRFAALVGIVRHAENPALAADARANIQNSLLAVIKAQAPPEGRDPAVHDALRRNCAQGLAALGSVGPQNAVVTAFDSVINNPAERPQMRAAIASELGSLDFPAGGGINFKLLADHVGHMSTEIYKQELAQAKEQQREPSRRRLKNWNRQAMDALIGSNSKSGLKAAASDPNQQKFIDAMLEKLKAVDKAFENSSFDSAVLAQVSGKLDELESMLQPRGVAPKVPAKPVADQAAPKAPAEDGALVNKPGAARGGADKPRRRAVDIDPVHAAVHDEEQPDKK